MGPKKQAVLFPEVEPKARRVIQQKEATYRWRAKNRARVSDTQRRYCLRNKERLKDRMAGWRRKSTKKKRDAIKARIGELKARPCTDCGRSYPPEVMDFDHVRGEKKFDVSLAPARPIRDLEIEVLKCEVVCANCHRQRTALRRRERA